MELSTGPARRGQPQLWLVDRPCTHLADGRLERSTEEAVQPAVSHVHPQLRTSTAHPARTGAMSWHASQLLADKFGVGDMQLVLAVTSGAGARSEVIGWIVAMLPLRQYRARVPYWVQRTQESQAGVE